MLFSPLEQFEPIPLLVIFLGGINFSITNVTIIFIYIVLVLCYFLNGYLFNVNDSKTINLVHPKLGTLSIAGVNQFNYLKKFYGDFNAINLSKNFYTNKSVSYLTFLADSYQNTTRVKNFKEEWLGLNVLALPNLKSEYSREFHRFFFANLVNKDISLPSDYAFFNKIVLYYNNFLNNLYFQGQKLNLSLLKSKLLTRNVLYFFATQENYAKAFISNFNIYVFENLYNAILAMVKDNIGGNLNRAVRFFPFIFSLFIFILLANLIGLIPYSSTVTSYLIITFAMAVMVLVGVNIIAGRLHGLVYFGHFLPAGCPFPLYPLIIPIEFISYVFRVVSLSVRLFANMMAGHTLLAVLAGFGWTMANASVSLLTFHFLPLLVVTGLVFLETAVAIIQAYVFTILTCMYLDEAINLH